MQLALFIIMNSLHDREAFMLINGHPWPDCRPYGDMEAGMRHMHMNGNIMLPVCFGNALAFMGGDD